MAEDSLCPSCGKPVPTNAPSGICPTCLMKAGMPNHDEATVTPHSKPGFVPPDVATLAGQLPQLEVFQLVGCGGMGAVYKARQIKLDRTVALKVLRSETSDDLAFAERFNREARTLARLSHPNIVGVHDFGEVQIPDERGQSRTLYYFVMEYVDGADLRRLMDTDVSTHDALSIVSQVCSALQYAHEQGIVHRDIKPENILLDAQGRVKIADFGLAKLATKSEFEHTLTGTHQVMGTPRYMAPEQMEGSSTVDHRADLYSLGVVLYEMLTGEVPMGQFEPPSKKTSDVGARLDNVVLQAMAREPDRRFQSANDMLKGLAEAAADSPSLRSAPLPGASTILELAVGNALAGIKRGVTGQSGLGSIVPGILALALSGVALAGHIEVLTGHAGLDAFYNPFRRDACLSVAAILLLTLSITLLAFGIGRKLSLWRPLVVIQFAVAITVLQIVYLTGFVRWADERSLRDSCGMLILASVGLLLIGAWDLRSYMSYRKQQPKPVRTRKSLPESAHVGFVVPPGTSPVPHIAPHFQMLGYQLVNQSANEWVFERGSKSGHMGVDLRKCFTVLTVRMGPRPDGSQWISCGWAVQAFVSGGEVTKLEQEGQNFARAIGVDTVTLTAASSIQVSRGQALLSVLGGSSRTGKWACPSRLSVVSLLGGCEVDFREAELKEGVSVISVVGVLGAVDITVPPDVTVEVSGLGLLGSFGHEGLSRSGVVTTNATILRFTGLSLLGVVSITTKA